MFHLCPYLQTVVRVHCVAGMMEEYFNDANHFRPERWLRSETTENVNPYLHLPFGAGPRMCIGRRLAEQDIYVMLLKVRHRWSPLDQGLEGKKHVHARVLSEFCSQTLNIC